MRGWRRPALAWLALAVYLLPASAFAQATKAGVVTTLEGNVTAVRAVAPQPVALKFKDDVFLQDRVVTGEQSFARLLLGGKAVVSIRERSAVTITEVPGRSTIDVESGKIALSVARDRMQPGEVINIKMPNAVAGVRGTVVIAEVSYAMVGGARQASSNLAVLRGQVEAVHTNAAGAAIGVPVMVGALQKFSATPTSASTGTFTVEQIGGIVQGLQSKGAADPGPASQAPARLEAVNTAVALLTALTGTTGSQAVQHLATGTSPELTTPNDTTPEAKITEAGDTSLSPVVPGGSPLSQLTQLPPAPPPPMNMTSLPSGQSLLTFTGSEVQSSDGTPIVPTTDPLLSTTGFTISQQGADDLIVAKSDANITLPGPLMKLTDTSVQAGDAFLSVAGHVSSTSPQPFIDLDPTSVMAPGNLVEVIGPAATLGLAGTLVKDTGGTVTVGGSVVAVSEGGTLTSTGSGALVQLNGTTMTASSLLSVVGSSSSANLNGGTLLSAQGGSLGITGIALADISSGARVTSSSTQPFANIVGTALALPESTFVVSGGQLTVGGSLLRAESLPVGTSFGLLVDNGGVVTVGGPVFDVVNSIVGARIVLGNGSVLTSQGGPLVRITGPPGTLTSLLISDTLVTTDGTGNGLTLRGPALDASNAIVAISRLYGPGPFDAVALRLNPGDPVVRLDSTVTSVSAPNEPFLSRGAAAGQDRSQAGVSLIATATPATPTVVAIGGSLLRLGTVDLTDVAPQIQLSNSSVVYTGTDPAVRLIDVTGQATVSGPLIGLVDGSIGTIATAPPIPGSGVSLPGQLPTSGTLIGVRGALTTGQAPLVIVDGSTGAIVGVQRVLRVEPGGALGLGGSALSLANGTVSAGTVLDFAAPVNTPVAGSAIALSGGTLLASDALFSATANVGIGGGLLAQSGGNVVTGGAAVASITGAAFLSQPAAVFQLTGGSLSAFGLGGGDLLRASAATVSLGGALLSSENAAVSLAGAVASLNNGSHLVQTAGPVVSVRGGSFSAGALLKADGTGNTFAFTGTVLDLADTTARLGLIADFLDQGTDVVTLSLAAGEPAARVTRSTLRIDRGPFVSLVNDVCSSCPPIIISGVALISTGTAATPSSITVGDELVALGNVAFLGADPIAQLTRTTVQQTGDGSAFISWFPDATFGAATTKPLLVATDSTLDVPGRAIFQFGGARLAATTGGAPFLSLINTTVNAGWLVDMLSGQLEVAGPLAAFSGGSSTIGGALLRIPAGAAVVTSASTPTVSIAGGTHQFGWVFELDNGGVTADQVVTGFGASPDVTLRLGTTQPLRQDSGVLQAPLLSASNATINTATGLRLDTVRLDTFSRLFDFTNSAVTGGSLGFIDLARSARLTASIPDAGLVNLFHSTMTLSGSALARVRGAPTTGGSLLQIGTPTATSSLVSLAGGSTLALLTNAPLLSVTDGSAAQILGSLISYVGTGNAVTVDNNLCLAFICATVNGVKIARGASVLLSSIRIETDPISGLAGNTLTIGDDDALILIDGADSRLLIAGTGADVPDVRIDDTFVALNAGQTLKTFSGISTRSGTSPVVFIRDSLVDGPDATLVVADLTANATLQAGPLMKITNSTLEIARLLLVQGTLISRGASPLIALDPVTINAQTLVEVAAGGNLSLAGPLLTDLGGTISPKQDAIIVAGSLMSTGAAALVGFQGTNLNVGTAASQASLFKITGPVSLGGPLLSASGATVRTTGDAVGIFDGGQLAQAGGAALLLLSNSSLTAGNASLARLLNVSGVGGTSGQTPSTAVITGALLDATNSVVTATGNGVGVFNGALFSSLGAPLFMLNATSLTTGPAAPANELDGALLSVSGSANGTPSIVTLQGPLVSAFGNSALISHGNVMQIAQGTVVLGLGSGPLVQTIDSTFTTSFDVLAAYNGSIVRLGGPLLSVIGGSLDVGRRVVGVFDGSDVSAVAGDALATLVNGNHFLGRDPGSAAFIVGDAGSRLTVPGGLLALNGANVTMFGAFLQIAASGALNGAGPLLDMTGGTLSSNTTNAFISINGSPVTPGALAAQQLMRVTAGANLVLRGSLVSILDTTLTATDVNRSAFAITDGATLSTTATASPLFAFNGSVFGSSQVTVARQLIEVSGTPASSMNLSGPLLAATNATIRTGDPAANPFGLVSIVDSATVTSTTSLPFVSFVNSTVDLAGTVATVRRSASVAAPTSLTLSGTLLFASGSSITTTSLGFDAFFETKGQTCCSVVSIRQGARLVTTADQPLIQLASSRLNDGPDARSGGTIFSLQDSLVGTTGELTAPATASLAGQLLAATNSNISALFNIITITNSTLTSTTTSPLVALSGGSLTLGGANPLDVGALTFARGVSLSGAGAVLSLQGSLFDFSNMNATITGELLGVFNSSLLKDTTTQPLIKLSGGTFTTGPTANFMSIASGAGLSPSMQLAGPLLSATNATLRNGDPTTFVPQTLSTLHAFTFIGDSAQVRSTSTQPLFDFNGISLTASADVMSLRRSLTTASPTRLTLDGPLLRAFGNTSIDVTSLALGSACCSVFDVEQAAQLVSTTTAALIQVDASRINAGPDAQSGGTLFLMSDSGLADGPIVASPARVILNGPLISSVNSKLSSLFSLVGVGRSTLTSTSLDPLIQLTGFKDDLALQLGGVDPFVALPNNQTRTGRVLNVVASATTATVGDAALVSLAGPLLSAVQAPIQLTADVIGVFNGAKVDSTSTLPFVRLSGETTALVAGATDPGSNTVVDGRLLLVSGIGGPDGVTPASLTLSGPFLRQEAGSIVDTNSRGLTLLTDGALVTRAPPTDTSYPLLQVNASSLSVGGTSRTGVLFEVTGSGALAADTQTNPVTGEASTLQFGQQRPLQHNGRGALLEASNSAFVNIRGANGAVLRLDTALLDATAPIFLLTTAARVQTSGNGIDLVRNARLQASNASDAVVRIDSQARMDVLNGHLASVSASRINVAGDLVRMGSNSLLNVTNGVLLSVLNGGIANINGALVAFTGVGGTINITNNLAPTAFIAGIPVNVAPGGNIFLGQGALSGLNVNQNTIRINGAALPTNATSTSGITGSLISVGANGTVRVGGGLN